ncbi:CheR family methyltransferase [Lacibacterium aquatile]|uniref:CheR family methyltransferase n=1 Tax=Lacibacterium aquatile TaxID=1168082 RepID=A0ABW5DTX1_9PROT
MSPGAGRTEAPVTAVVNGAFLALKERVIARTGHFYYQDKDDLLWDRVLRRMLATGRSDCQAYLDLLAESDGEWAALEADITIGETFFFRYGEQFAALRETILPDLIARNAEEKRLRIWSAGCATGAEAYSVAIVLRELLGDAFADWRISILGTDINERFLGIAREGRFGRWALRVLDAEKRAAYFTQNGENDWSLRPRYRGVVRFERHNLLSLTDGTSPLEMSDFDLVLCRNVLIYFHPDMVVQIVAGLRRSLREGGWMLLGHAEPNPVFERIMRTVNLPGTVAYRNMPPESAPQLDVPQLAALAAPAPMAEPLVPRPKPVPKPAPVHAAVVEQTQVVGETIDDLLAAVRRLADAGDLRGALAICDHALDAAPTDARLQYYAGMIHQGLGQMPIAEKAFRRALYLNQGFVMAQLGLGLLLVGSGRRAQGQRYIANAAQLSASWPADDPVPEGDGMTAAQLRQIARNALARTSAKKGRSPW